MGTLPCFPSKLVMTDMEPKVEAKNELKSNMDIKNNDNNTELSNDISRIIVPSSKKKGKRGYIEINVNNFIYNVNIIKDLTKKTGCQMIAVVKGDCYGHGSIRLCNEMIKLGIKAFAVATVIEGIELRLNGITNDKGIIIVLGAPNIDEYILYDKYNLDIMLSNEIILNELIQYCNINKNKKLRIHVMIDTGMTRIGLNDINAIKCIKQINDIKNIQFIGLCTHMSHEGEYTLKQFNIFKNVLNKLDEININVSMFHCENSKTLVSDIINDDVIKSLMDSDTLGYTRCGGALYGNNMDKYKRDFNIQLKGLMTFKAQIRNIMFVKKDTFVGYDQKYKTKEDTYIGTLSVGYSDGYPRILSNKGKVRIGNKLYNVVGLVCMDMMMIDIGMDYKENNIKMGDYAVLFGPKCQHKLNITIEDIAKMCDTNNVEIWTKITKRIPRMFV